MSIISKFFNYLALFIVGTVWVVVVAFYINGYMSRTEVKMNGPAVEVCEKAGGRLVGTVNLKMVCIPTDTMLRVFGDQ